MRPRATNRIIHVPRRFVAEEWGGTETVVMELSRRQQAAGARPEILTSMALALKSREEIQGVRVRRFNYSYPFLGLSKSDRAAMDKKGGNLLSFSLFGSLMAARDVRIFHAHALKRLGGEVRTAARLRRKPFVVSLHGGVFDVPAAERDQMMMPIRNKPEWGKVFGALFGSRRILEDADHVVCVGESEMKLAKQSLKHDRISYLPNGVDTLKFASGNGAAFRAKHGIPAGAFVVLNISRIDSQKNQSLLIEAFALFRRERADAFLVLIGPETQPEYAAKLKAFIINSGLQDRILMLPGIRNDDPDLVDAYHACDVFVLPSMHEPFGIVVLEAWSAGRPVLVNHVGGLKSLVRHGQNGLFINPGSDGSAEDLSRQLGLLAASPRLGKALGESGRVEAVASYDWSQVTRRMEAVYRAAEKSADLRYGRTRL